MLAAINSFLTHLSLTLSGIISASLFLDSSLPQSFWAHLCLILSGLVSPDKFSTHLCLNLAGLVWMSKVRLYTPQLIPGTRESTSSVGLEDPTNPHGPLKSIVFAFRFLGENRWVPSLFSQAAGVPRSLAAASF